MSYKILYAFLLVFVFFKQINAETAGEEEKAAILKFFDTTDQYEITYMRAALNVLHDILNSMIDGVPAEKRGPSCQVIQKYSDEIAACKDGSDLLAMRAKYGKLSSIGDKIQTNIVSTNHEENETLRIGIFKMMVFPFKTQADAATYDTNLKAAIANFKESFIYGNLHRHRKLNNILRDFERTQDTANDTSLQKKFRKIEADYRAGRRG